MQDTNLMRSRSFDALGCRNITKRFTTRSSSRWATLALHNAVFFTNVSDTCNSLFPETWLVLWNHARYCILKKLDMARFLSYKRLIWGVLAIWLIERSCSSVVGVLPFVSYSRLKTMRVDRKSAVFVRILEYWVRISHVDLSLSRFNTVVRVSVFTRHPCSCRKPLASQLQERLKSWSQGTGCLSKKKLRSPEPRGRWLCHHGQVFFLCADVFCRRDRQAHDSEFNAPYVHFDRHCWKGATWSHSYFGFKIQVLVLGVDSVYHDCS